MCFAAGIILHVEVTSRNYQYYYQYYYQSYYQYMGTLLDSAPEVPEDIECETFLSLAIIIQMRWLNNH
jgi:hypothetical protein